MKLLFRTLAGAVLAMRVAGAAPAPAGRELHRAFARQVPLPGPFEAGALYRLPVTPELRDAALLSPARDVRVLDRESRNWPFLLWTPPPGPGSVPVPSRRINRLAQPPPDRGWSEELEVGRGGDASAREFNEAVIQTGGGDYIRRVEISARPDENTPWAEVGSGWLVRHVRGAAAENNTIRLPPCTLPHLKVRVYPDARRAGEAFDISSIELRRSAARPAPLEDLDWRPLDPAKDDLLPEAQVWVFDTGGRATPVRELTFSTTTSEYARSVRISCRDALTNRWRHVASGEIHRLGGRSEQNRVHLNGDGRYWRVELFHFDDPPLAEVTLRARGRPDWIVFEARDPGPAALYVGSDAVSAPSFDLARRKTDADFSGARPLAPSPPQANPDYRRPGPSGRRVRALVLAGIAIASVLVLAVILRMMKGLSHPAGPAAEA